MRKFMPTLVLVALSTLAAQPASAQSIVPMALYAPTTLSIVTLAPQLAIFSGTGMAYADCQTRISMLETMLGTWGFGRRSTRSDTDGRVYARWYDPIQNLTVVAMTTASDDGMSYALDAYGIEGKVRWTDALLIP